MKLNLHIIFILFFIFYYNTVVAGDYYQRHYVLLVDQTEYSMKEDPDGLQAIGKMLSNIFLNKDIMIGVDKAKINDTETYLTNLNFDPETDEISLFKFGTTSNRNNVDDPTYGLGRIRDKISKGANELLALADEVIQPVAQFHKSGKSITQFIEGDFIPLLSGPGLQSGINFSSIVYPCVLGKIDSMPPAAEYIIIIISNFKVIGTLDNRFDYGIIRSAMKASQTSTEHAENFAKQLWQLNNPFYTSEIMKVQSLKDRHDASNQMTPISTVKAVCYQLGLKSLKGVSCYITSNLELHETRVGATTYYLNDVNISFNKDKNLKVDSLLMKVFSSQKECLWSQNISGIAAYDSVGTKSYHIPPFKLDLNRVFRVGDDISFQYLIFASAKDDQGKALLPIVFSTERDYNITTDTLISPEEQKQIMIIKMVIALLGLLGLGLLAFFIWRKRGFSRQISIDFTIWPISHDRFMEVKDKKVSSFDCWYWRYGDTDMNIPISGKLCFQRKPFAKMCSYKLEAQIQDIDDNNDFSFRPDPTIKESNGSDRIPNKWYEVPINSDGSFQFSANTYIESGTQPNFCRENILEMKVSLRCIMGNGREQRFVVERKEHKYSFIVRPEIDNRNIWVAFDPGTTGSCVAYGATSNPTDTNDIYLAENEYETLNEGTGKSHIFPSMIRINNRSSRIFRDNAPIETFSEGEDDDFLFGNSASMLWDIESVNCFQSIKKLLGYTDVYKIVSREGQIKDISGRDIAHLLVKGLYNHVQNYIEKDQTIHSAIRDMFVRDGIFTPQRAIVAVPNNYTLIKIQEMVDTVKRTNKFKEVHYIYEAEATMMMYFRQCWKNLPKMTDKIFVVFDMGGATINATAFKIDVILGEKSGNKFIRRVDVKTISRIGYGVGGDDIDFALIQIIYNLPSVKGFLVTNEIDNQEHQIKNKENLIRLVRGLKLEIIAKANNDITGLSHLSDAETLYGHLRENLGNTGIHIQTPMTEDLEYLNNIIDTNRLTDNSILSKDIYGIVKDSVQNLLSSIKEKNDIELIMSGRSILFPGIRQQVIDTIREEGFKCHRWEGFDDEHGNFSSEKVKAAVATGACWYAMYSDYINLYNRKVTSSFGFIDMIGLEQKFIPVIKRNEDFNEEGYIELSEDTKSNLANVKFIQMLGAENDYDDILKEDIRHKYNVLDEVRPAEIRTSAETVFVKVDDKGNFSYKIKIQGKSSAEDDLFKVEDNTYSRLSKNNVKTEIVNENSPSYIFSTLNLLKTDRGIIERYIERQKKTGTGIRF